MRNLWKSAACLLVLAGLFSSAGAQEEASRPIRFARHPSLSPDGKAIAFSYLGDIWKVPAEGGAATRLTIHEAHDQLPFWSPDGKWIAFSSSREGNYDVYLVPSVGGRAKQLTFHSASDSVNGWSPDGKRILFASNRAATRSASLYTLDVATGATRLVASDDFALNNAAFSPDGSKIAATRGGSWMRKRYRGSANSSLMLFPAQGGGAGKWLAKGPENERWPQFSPDGKTCFYVSDKSGAANLWKRNLSDGRASQVTKFTGGNLFYPNLARNGALLVFEQDFSLWTLPAAGGEPKRLRIFAPSDDRTNMLRREAFRSGVQEAQLSPDGKQIAFVVHGEIFVQPTTPSAFGNNDAARLTETPQREEDIAWSPDSGKIAFTSDRTGDQSLFVVDVKTKQTKQLTNSGRPEHSPVFSPDGRWIAFLCGYSGEELCVMPAGGGEARHLVRDPHINSVTWSPDSKWLAYMRMKSHSAGSLSDIFLLALADGKPVNLTRWPVINAAPEWAADGKKLFFLSNRSGNMNLWSVSLEEEKDREAEAEKAEKEKAEKKDGPAKPGEKRPVEVKINLDDIHRRAKQLTRVETGVGSYALSPDSKTVVFAMTQMGRPDLWRIAADGEGAPARLTQSGESGAGLRFAPDGARVYYQSGGGIRSLALAAPNPAPVAIVARMEIDTRAELTQMFDEAWRKMRDSFYDEKMHGADWNAVRNAYRPLLADIASKEDFYTLFSLVLGELNASHTGISGPREDRGQATASLGVTFDDAYSGPGVKVKAVMPKGPADKDESRLNVGDIILKVDGQAVGVNEKLYSLLADKAGRRLELLVNTEPKEEGARTVKLRAISLGEYDNLEYERWHKEREQITERLSQGKLGYLHLSSMNNPNLEKFERAVFGDMQEKEGLVLDVRFNGGGSIADEIFAILQDRVFSYRTLRGDPNKTTAPLTAWNKPIIVLINESSFSNAEIFPWGFKELKLGKVVGMPTYGAVIGTGGTNLIDGSSLRTPVVGSYTLSGINMENNGCPPDITVENTPEDIYLRRDRQLERAVQELRKQVAASR